MATLFNTKISATYEGLFKTIDNAAITASLKELTDGSGNQSGLYVNNAGDFKVSNILEWGSLKDTGTGVTITRYVTSTDGIENFDNNTSLPTSAAVKLYVDSKFATSDTLQEVLSFGNTTGGNDIVVSASDDITFTDSSKAIFGAGSDLQIYHDGSNSYINEVGTGFLKIWTNDLEIQSNSGTETLATFATNGAVELYFDNSKKLETTATGVTITGRLSGLTNPTLAQDATTKSYVDALDAGSDLDITDGTTAGAVNLNTQSLSILGTTNEIDSVVSGQSVTIGLPSSISTNLVGNVTGNVTGDLTGTASLIDVSNTATNQNQYILQSAGTSGSQTVFADSNLYFNPVTNLLTVEGSGSFTGDLNVTGNITGGGGSFLPLAGGTMTGNTIHNDNVKSIYGTASDGLEIFHNGTDSYISDTGTGSLNIKSDGAFIDIQSNSTRINNAANSEIMATFVANGAVSLYYDNSNKLATTNTGISVTGDGAFSGSVQIPNAGQLQLGTGNHMILQHNSANGFIKNLTGQLNIDQAAVTQSIVFRVSDANSLDTTALTISRNGDLTTGRDVTIAGDLTVNGTTTTVNSQTLAVVDPLIQLAKDNTANSLDIGLYGDYNDGTDRFLGLFSDASDSNKFKLFKGTTVEPTTTVNIGGAGYVAADLQVAGFEGTTGTFTGSVGIGVVAEVGSKLHIKTTSGNAKITIESPDTGNPYINYSAATNEMSAGYNKGDSKFIIAGGNDLSVPLLSVTQGTGNTDVLGIVSAPQVSVTTTSTTEPVLRLIDAGVIAYDWTFPGDNTLRLGVLATSTKKLELFNSGTGAFNLDVKGTITSTDDITIDNASPELFLTPDSNKYSWMVAAQENVDQSFEITPSTAVGGTTFNAPAFQINGANSNVTLAANLIVPNGLISTIGGNNLTISGSVADHAGISFATNSILPATVSVTNDNTVDLGQNGNAFKNLYLGSEIISAGGATFAGDLYFGANANIFKASGNLTLDVGGHIILDADSGEIAFKDGGTTFLEIANSSSDAIIRSTVQDKDILFNGNDNGSAITALQLDMSNGGSATFRDDIDFGGKLTQTGSGTNTLRALNVGSSGTSRFTDTNAFPLQINRGLDVDVYGANGAYLSMGSLKGSTYVDAIRMSGGLAANGTDGSYTLQTLGGGNYTTALSINSSQESTFAGNITMASATALTGMNTLRLENGTNKRNLSCDGAGNLDISNAANNATIFHLQDSSLTLGTTLGTGSLQLYSGNINVGNRTALNNSFFGYSSSYRTLIVGTTGDDYQTNASSICFGVSLNGNSSPSFTGNGTEYFWRNAGSFKTPNSINNGYNTLLQWNNNGNVAIGNTAPSTAFNVWDGINVTGANAIASDTSGNYILSVGANSGSKGIITKGNIFCDSSGILLGGDTTANLLNDYEEGTWTPTAYYQNSTDQANVTYTTQHGTYTKVGNLVTVHIYLVFNQGSGAPANDNVGIGGFPFRGTDALDVGAGTLMFSKGQAQPYFLRHPSSNGTLALIFDYNLNGNQGNEIGNGAHTFATSITYKTDE